MKKSKQILFFGSDNFSLPALLTLLEDEYWQVAGVVTRPDQKAGRGQKLVPTPPKTLAAQYQLPVLTPAKLDTKALKEIKALEAGVAVVVSYGRLIPNELLEHFAGLVINIHPSLLPRYRGPAPIEAAILNGDEVTGVTLMQVSEEMDAGGIYAQTEIPLTGSETAPQLQEQLAIVGAKLLIENLLNITNQQLAPQPQDDARASYTQLIKKSDGVIDWSKSAVQIEREVRAYRGWPGSRSKLAGAAVTITAAQAVQALDGITPAPGAAQATPDKKIAVGCGEGILVIERMQPAGKREMSAPEFLAGNQL